jgi:hypothetical protein
MDSGQLILRVVVGVALGVAAAIATLLMRRPAAAQPAHASGYDKPLGKAA